MVSFALLQQEQEGRPAPTSTGKPGRLVPLAACIAKNWYCCVAPLSLLVLALTTSAPLTGSMTGVDVTPTKGPMLPHGSVRDGTGSASLRCHTT